MGYEPYFPLSSRVFSSTRTAILLPHNGRQTPPRLLVPIAGAGGRCRREDPDSRSAEAMIPMIFPVFNLSQLKKFLCRLLPIKRKYLRLTSFNLFSQNIPVFFRDFDTAVHTGLAFAQVGKADIPLKHSEVVGGLQPLARQSALIQNLPKLIPPSPFDTKGCRWVTEPVLSPHSRLQQYSAVHTFSHASRIAQPPLRPTPPPHPHLFLIAVFCKTLA